MPIAAMLAESVKALIKLRRFMVRSPWSLCFSGWQMQTLEGAFARGVPGWRKALKRGVDGVSGKWRCTISDRIAGAGAMWRSALGRGVGLIQGEIFNRTSMLVLLDSEVGKSV
jgi:hypothetical protein